MSTWGSDAIAFDYDGALEAARKLWVLADALETYWIRRLDASELAAQEWLGALRSQFTDRVNDELHLLANGSQEVRIGALGWAQAWKEAMDENNARARARKVTEIRDNRSWAERNLGDRVLGDDSDSQVPEARVVAVPQPPNFAPTDSPQVFA